MAVRAESAVIQPCWCDLQLMTCCCWALGDLVALSRHHQHIYSAPSLLYHLENAATHLFTGRRICRQPCAAHFLVHAGRFIELQPDDCSGYSNRGYAFRKLAKYTAAVEDYTAAIQLGGGTSTRLHNNRCCRAGTGLPSCAIMQSVQAEAVMHNIFPHIFCILDSADVTPG
jgi:hypothetical protein